MLKHPHILPSKLSPKRLVACVKTILASNLVFGFLVVPQGNLIIPQNELNNAFAITTNQEVAKPQIQFPIEFTYISQKFSYFHPGVDLATKYGTPIKPILPGTVKEAGYSLFGYGNMILIEHDGDLESLYAHLSKIFIKKGDYVDENTILGLVGTTGHSTGPHLHLEIHEKEKPVNPLNLLPSPLLATLIQQ